MSNFDLLDKIYEVILERQQNRPEDSYVTRLFEKGRAKIAQKIGEEATELVIEAIEDKKKAVISESADLLFHMMVLWADMGLSPDKIVEELARRRGISGLEEKAARKKAKK